jgi:hypothetical protein
MIRGADWTGDVPAYRHRRICGARFSHAKGSLSVSDWTLWLAVREKYLTNNFFLSGGVLPGHVRLVHVPSVFLQGVLQGLLNANLRHRVAGTCG